MYRVEFIESCNICWKMRTYILLFQILKPKFISVTVIIFIFDIRKKKQSFSSLYSIFSPIEFILVFVGKINDFNSAGFYDQNNFIT